MPRYAQPSLPADVEPIVDALGANRARVAVLLDLIAHPASTRTDIAQRTGLGRKLILGHLQDLQSRELVVVDEPPAGRRPARYTVLDDKLRRQFSALDARMQRKN